MCTRATRDEGHGKEHRHETLTRRYNWLGRRLFDGAIQSAIAEPSQPHTSVNSLCNSVGTPATWPPDCLVFTKELEATERRAWETENNSQRVPTLSARAAPRPRTPAALLGHG